MTRLNIACALMLLALCFFAPSPSLFAQKNSRYKERLTPGNKLVRTGVNYQVERTPEKKYVLKRFYFETAAQTAELTFTDKGLQNLEGPSTQWFDSGELWKQGNYKQGQKTGVWKESNVPPKGQAMNTGEYRNGERIGTWIETDSSGNVAFKRAYEKGELLSKVKIRPDGSIDTLQLDNSSALQVEPSFPCSPEFEGSGKKCGEQSLYTHLYKNIVYPRDAMDEGITGAAYINFVVGKDGSIQDPYVINGICDAIKKECLRIVISMPQWTPGSYDGKPVRVRYTLPIRFNLE